MPPAQGAFAFHRRVTLFSTIPKDSKCLPACIARAFVFAFIRGATPVGMEFVRKREESSHGILLHAPVVVLHRGEITTAQQLPRLE